MKFVRYIYEKNDTSKFNSKFLYTIKNLNDKMKLQHIHTLIKKENKNLLVIGW